MRGAARRGLGSSAGILAALLMGALGATMGCVLHHGHPVTTPPTYAWSYGPPPHAPAHGYRHRHHRDGVYLVYDAGLGVYVVSDWPSTYWYVDRYLRWKAGEWFVSHRIDGTWVVVASDRVPAKLVAKHRKKARRHRRRHSAPARHDH